MPASIEAFFHEPTDTVTYLVSDPATRRAAIIDPVLDYDPKSGHTASDSAARIIEAANAKGLTVDWILETHAHADHLSAGDWLRRQTGARIVIGAGIAEVQKTFARLFNLSDIATDGSQFDRLVNDGDTLEIGSLQVTVMHTPGHTPGCVSYRIDDAIFVGDTMFMPDYGSARCDFPGGDARTLYRSIKRIFALPPATRIFLCHDYKAPGRDHFAWETTVAEQRAKNLHLHDGIDEDAFVKMRTERDARLQKPVLLIPAIQVNIRAGELPPPEPNGTAYLKIPLNRL